LHPFSDVPVHIEQAPRIRYSAINWNSSPSYYTTAITRPAIEVCLADRRRRSPPIGRLRSCACNVFAFGFRKQSIVSGRTLREPFHIFDGVLPTDAHDWMIIRLTKPGRQK